MKLACSLVLAALSGLAPTASADTDRVEVWPIATSDVSTTQLYRGATAADGPARTIAGELRLPNTTRQRVPAVVFLHGDAGATWNQPPWTDELVAAGFAVFTVDSFSGRGAVSPRPFPPVIDDVPGSATRLVDAYAALAVLAAHPRIDASRIALMGVSSGGRTTMLAAMKRFSSRLAQSDARFAAYLALYPPCVVTLVGDEQLEAAPLRIFIGGADDVTPAAACRTYVDRARAAGVDAAITVYPGAFHGFDAPPGRHGSHLADEPSARDCRYVERDGAIVNAQTGKAPDDADRCMTTGVTFARDAAADRAARNDVRTFLTGALQPKR